MNIFLLDVDLSLVDIIDTYESFIWTDRYSEPGDFELYLMMDERILSECIQDRYLQIEKSDRLMIIEDIEITTDIEEGDKLKITGKSLESLLERRIVWEQTVLNTSLQNGIKQLINNAIIAPKIAARKISNFIFIDSTDPAITGLKIDAQYTGDNLGEVIKNQCELNDIGYRVLYNQTTGNFEFSLYKGTDRSYNQDVNPYVIFSPDYSNIINSDYIESNNTLKNVALVAGEGEGKDRKTTTIGESSGMARRELFVDARDISSNTDSGTLSAAEYTKELQTRGNEQLAENKQTKSFSGEIDVQQNFKLDEDFTLGDVVQLVNEYQIQASVRITEIVLSISTTGMEYYPTFKAIDKEYKK